jgi:hypothetical protein
MRTFMGHRRARGLSAGGSSLARFGRPRGSLRKRITTSLFTSCTCVALAAACSGDDASSSALEDGSASANPGNAQAGAQDGAPTGNGPNASGAPSDGNGSPGSTPGSIGDGINTGSSNGNQNAPDAPEVGVGVDVISQCINEDAVGPTPIRRLGTVEYYNAVRDALGSLVNRGDLPADEKLGVFQANVASPLVQDNFDRYLFVAGQVAAGVVSDFPSRSGCSSTADVACTQSYLVSKARQLFHGTLDASDQATLEQLYSSLSTQTDPDLATETALTWILTSPRFLFVVEFGEAGGSLSPLTPSEIAGRLAAFIWRSVPDDALLAAADSGALDTADGVRAQASSMLGDERAKAVLKSFGDQWLRISPAPPDASSLDTQIAAQVGDVLGRATNDDSLSFPDLLTADMSQTAGAELAALYGTDPHNGLLLSAGFLASNSSGSRPSPVKRGYVLRSSLLCQPIPPPADPTAMQLPDASAGSNDREIFNEHSSTPECWSCHQLMDPLGNAFGNYDASGLFDASLADDTSGTVYGAQEVDFSDTQDLLNYLASDATAQNCFALQMTRFALGRGETEGDACSLQRLTESFRSKDFSIQQLMVEIASSQIFLNRNPVVAGSTCR